MSLSNVTLESTPFARRSLVRNDNMGGLLSLVMGSGLYRLALASIVVAEHTGYSRFGTYGGFAVYSFFVISGYWIARLWHEQSASYGIFLISRVWRLWPSFVLTVLICDIWFQQFDLSDFRFFDAAYRANPLMPQVWSLSFEIQFYALSPILIGAFVNPWLWLITVAIALIYFLIGDTLLAIACLGFFLIGAIGARFEVKPNKSVALAAAIFGIALAVFAVSTLPLGTIVNIGHLLIGYAFLFNVALAFVFVPFTLWTLTLKSAKIDRAFGEISYTLYLVHLPLLSLLPFELLTKLTLCGFAAIALWILTWPSEWARKEIVARWSVRTKSTFI